MECTCSARPLQRWLTSLPDRTDPDAEGSEWKSVLCSEPSFLSGQPLVTVPEAKLTCTPQQIREEPEFDLTPDIKFRDLHL